MIKLTDKQLKKTFLTLKTSTDKDLIDVAIILGGALKSRGVKI